MIPAADHHVSIHAEGAKKFHAYNITRYWARLAQFSQDATRQGR
jgi:hypothetical protein